MTRPQIVVNVAAALQRRGAPTDTGTAFMVYAGATGSTVPVECTTIDQITATAAPGGVQALIAMILAQGAAKVYAVRAVAANVAAVTESEWAAALDTLTDEYGAGQVLIPGVSTPAAHAALLEHAHRTTRCALLDTDKAATATAITAQAGALAAAEGARYATLLAGWPVSDSPTAAVTQIPPSIAAAGLVARGDAATGHANHAPAGDQGRGAGYVTGSSDTVARFTDAEHDALHAEGVSVFRVKSGRTQLYGWVSLATEETGYRQLNYGRMAMQLGAGIATGAEQFLFRNIDGHGLLYSELEGMLRGYLADLYSRGALYGVTADDAYDVDVAGVNSPATAAAGELRAAVAVRLSSHTEMVRIDVVTSTATQEGPA